MDFTDLLKGRFVNVITDVGVIVQLEIDTVEEKSEHHSRDLEPATQANDWWPMSEDWTTSWVNVKFVNGHTKKYNSFKEIDLVK